MLPSWIKVTIVQLDIAAKSLLQLERVLWILRFCKYSTLAVYYDIAMDINWQICCLCQLDTQEFLQTPKKEGFISLEKDFKEHIYISIKGTLPSGVTVNLNDLNDGSDIVSTLETNQAKYHKKCRSYYSSCFKCLWEKMEKEVPCQLSLKKLRSCEDKPTNSSVQCVICQGNVQSNLNKVSAGPVDENLKEWAKASKNFNFDR